MKREILDLEQIRTVYICLADDISLQTLSLSQKSQKVLPALLWLSQAEHTQGCISQGLHLHCCWEASFSPTSSYSCAIFTHLSAAKYRRDWGSNHIKLLKGYRGLYHFFYYCFFKRSVRCTRQIGLTCGFPG